MDMLDEALLLFQIDNFPDKQRQITLIDGCEFFAFRTSLADSKIEIRLKAPDYRPE